VSPETKTDHERCKRPGEGLYCGSVRVELDRLRSEISWIFQAMVVAILRSRRTQSPSSLHGGSFAFTRIIMRVKHRAPQAFGFLTSAIPVPRARAERSKQ